MLRHNFSHVVNLGGYVNHTNKIKTYNSNYLGCKNLTEVFLNKSLKTFVQIGSSSEYGNLSSPQKESNKCKPKLTYGKSKLLATKHLISLNKEKSFPSVVLRLYQAFGPAQDLNRFMPIIISGCLKDKKFPCSEGTQFRDFIYVEDVVDAIFKSLKNRKALGEIINIGTGKTQKIRTVIENIKNLAKGGKPQFGKIKLRKDETLKIYPNISKAKKKLNWRPKFSFKEGLANTIRFYEKSK